MNFTTQHPDGLFCPVCGCGEIHWWPELIDWDKWTDEKKKSYENCPACGYDGREYNMKDRKENYVIFSRSESEIPGGVMYWSNEDGWTNYINSTRFSRREKQGFYLPMSKDNDAAWVRVCPEREE